MSERGRHERWTPPVSQRELARVFEAYAFRAARRGRVEVHKGVGTPGDIPASLYVLNVDATAVQRAVYPADDLVSIDPNGCEVSYASSFVFDPSEPECPVSQVSLLVRGSMLDNRLRFVHTYSIVRDDFGEQHLGGSVDSEYWKDGHLIRAEVFAPEGENGLERIVAVESKNRPIEFPEILKMSELIAHI